MIAIISGDFYRANPVAEHLIEAGFAVSSIYRAYQADEFFAGSSPDVVLGDGTCRDREGDDTFRVSYPTRQKAREVGAVYLPLWLPRPFLDLALRGDKDA